MDKVIREGIVRVGVDLAKRVIQVHAVDGAGRVVTARALPRDKFMVWCARLPPGCVVAMANKNARILWAVLAKGRRFDPDHVPVKPEGPALAVPARAG